MIKATNVRCHVGAQIGAQVYTSLDSKKDGFEMEMNNFGVFVTTKTKDIYFVPHGTVASVKLCADSFQAAQQEVKRGPGRPKAE